MHTNQKILVEAIEQAGGRVKVLDAKTELIEVAKHQRSEQVWDRFTQVVCPKAIGLTANKFLTKKTLIANDVACPRGQIFNSKLWEQAQAWAQNRYPLVLKPNFGSHGDDIHLNIQNQKDLNLAILNYSYKFGSHALFILEEFQPWPEYRLFITKNGDFAAINRCWAYVEGNGYNSIKELAQIESDRRLLLKKEKNTSLCPIVLDDSSARFLNEQGLHFQSVPLKGSRVYLRQESNLAKGGVSINVTDELVHLKSYAMSVLSLFEGLPMAGLDVLSPDIFSEAPTLSLLEVNSNPGLTMHKFPAIGKEEPIGSYVAKVMLPWIFE